MTIGRRLEDAFEAWGRFVLRFRWAALAFPLLVAGVLGAQAPGITIDNSDTKLLRPGDPSLVRFEAFRRQFGRYDVALVALRSPDVFDGDFLERLRAFHRDLEGTVPHLHEVGSLLNARSVRGEGDRLIVEGLLADWPDTPEKRARVKERVLANPLYRNTVISENGRLTLVSIALEEMSSAVGTPEALEGFEDHERPVEEEEPSYRFDAATSASVQAIREVIARHASPELPMYLTGSPIVAEQLNAISRRDMARFLALSMLGVAVFLFVLFRRAAAVLLPIAVVLAAIGSTLGLMALSGTPLAVITQVLPSFLFVVGVCDSIHLLAIVYQRMARGDGREEAIVFALRHSGLAILMTSLTTAAGLLSFITAEVGPIVDLGTFAPIGVGLAFFYTVTLLPAALAVLPARAVRHGGHSEHPHLDRVLIAFGNIATRNPRKVIAGSAVILCVALAGALQLRISFNSIEWFPEEDPLRVATDAIDRELRGSTMLEVMLHTEREDALHDPALLMRLDALAERLGSLEQGELFVGKVTSIVDIVKEIHQALHEGRPELRVIPQERGVVAQELLLFEESGSDHLTDVTDSRFSVARVTLRVPRVDATLYLDLIDRIEAQARERLGEFGDVHLTGGMTILGRLTHATAVSMARSYLLALLMITPMMMLVMGSVGRGLLSMVPNLAPILVGLGLMYWWEIPLDMTTMLLGSMVLGLAVDDTIHFMHRFGRYLEETGDAHRAVRLTLETTGTALLFTTLVLAAGFFILMLGYMVNVSNFGLLLGVSTLAAFLADVLLAPALVTLAVGVPGTPRPVVGSAKRRRRGRGTEGSRARRSQGGMR